MKPKVLSTRIRNGLRYRRYDSNGIRYSMVELPVSVVKSIGTKRVLAAYSTWQRGCTNRQRSAMLKEAILTRLGTKPTAIADELGCSEAYVRQILQTTKP